MWTVSTVLCYDGLEIGMGTTHRRGSALEMLELALLILASVRGAVLRRWHLESLVAKVRCLFGLFLS